jgi:hypothetical protein
VRTRPRVVKSQTFGARRVGKHLGCLEELIRQDPNDLGESRPRELVRRSCQCHTARDPLGHQVLVGKYLDCAQFMLPDWSA